MKWPKPEGVVSDRFGCCMVIKAECDIRGVVRDEDLRFAELGLMTRCRMIVSFRQILYEYSMLEGYTV